MQREAEAGNEFLQVICVADSSEFDSGGTYSTRESVARQLAAFGVSIEVDNSESAFYSVESHLCTLCLQTLQSVLPSIVNEVAVALASSGLTAATLYQLLKTWVDARNGRKLKLKIGDVEVEATQMKEEDVWRIFDLLEEKADRKKVRELLLNASSQSPEKSR